MLLVCTLALDAWQFLRRTKLAPANALVTVINQGSMRSSFANPALLLLPAVGPTLFTLGMELKAPTTSPNAVVSFDECSKVWPRDWA
jgi:hypothetical protein